MKSTIIAYARKHFTEMRRNYLSTFAGLILIAIGLPLVFREMLGITSEVGGEVLMCLAWASVLLFTNTAFRSWVTAGEEAFTLTLPVSTNRRFIFLGVSSLLISVVSTQVIFWVTYYAWRLLAGYNVLVLGEALINFLSRLIMVQVIIHSIVVLCYARGGRMRTSSWLVIVAGFALFYGLVNLPETVGWVSDNGARFPNLYNQMDIYGQGWHLSLSNRPLGKATDVVEWLCGASVVLAFYVSAWLSLKERESFK